MKVATVDGLMTLFYDGSKKLFNSDLDMERLIAQGRRLNAMRRQEDYSAEGANDLETLEVSDECKQYFRERFSWEQIIVVDGVTEIPRSTFSGCKNIKRVIFANTVIRIKEFSFCGCNGLVFIKWSICLVYVGKSAFEYCNLSSVFIPPTCQEICDEAFSNNRNLSIFHVSQDTELGSNVIEETAIARASPTCSINQLTGYTRLIAMAREIRDRTPQQRLAASNEMNTWIKNMNNDENFNLHRVCSSFSPSKEDILGIVLEKGLKAFQEENSAGITPSRYLQENPYTDLSEKEIIHDYLMKMMGELE